MSQGRSPYVTSAVACARGRTVGIWALRSRLQVPASFPSATSGHFRSGSFGGKVTVELRILGGSFAADTGHVGRRVPYCMQIAGRLEFGVVDATEQTTALGVLPDGDGPLPIARHRGRCKHRLRV